MDWKYGENVKIYLNGERLNCLVQKFETSLKKFVTDSLLVFSPKCKKALVFLCDGQFSFKNLFYMKTTFLSTSVWWSVITTVFFSFTFCIFSLICMHIKSLCTWVKFTQIHVVPLRLRDRCSAQLQLALLNTPEKTITYHNAFVCHPQNFA